MIFRAVADLLPEGSRSILGEIWVNAAWRRAAFFLLPYAGVLVGLAVAAHYGEVTDAHLPVQFFLSSDNSFGEWLEYSLTAASALMLLWVWRRTGAPAYFANGVLFVYLTLDNALEFHEKFGHAVAGLVPRNPFPVGANDLGEAALFAAVGLVWLLGLAFGVAKSQYRSVVHSLLIAAAIGAAAFFGVIVDLIVVWGEHSPALLEIETFIEDGGEFAMIIVAFLISTAIFDIERKRLA